MLDEYGDEEIDELAKLFQEPITPMPCVEYCSRVPFRYSGLLLDEERIIGLKVSHSVSVKIVHIHGAYHSFQFEDGAGAVESFDVFTL